MDILPAELHSHICSLACTDDGYTAQSLSLLSRYFFQISLPFRYQSICVTKVPQIQSLSTRLQATPSHLRRIHHLFISDDGCDLQALVNSFMTILTLAAPTLETLTLITTSSLTSASLIARIFRACFPHLHELTVFGHYPFPSTPSHFPSLERLHLLGNRNPHGLLSLGGLESVMPNLTHLRVSGLTLAVSFSQELEQAFTSSSTDEDCMFSAKLPPKLEQLSIQCGPELLITNPNHSARLKDEIMVQNLESLEKRVNKEGHATRFSLLARGTKKSTTDDLHEQWVDRLRGKTGCWLLT